jgi:alpha-beta hydrolase superfamily lysophospholipase
MSTAYAMAITGPFRGRPGKRTLRGACLGLLALLLVAGCTPVVMPAGPALGPPRLAEQAIIAADGATLPLRVFAPEGPPRAVMLALHGLNDHGGSFLSESIAALNAGGLLVYAYDQRGFGRAPNRGLWPGAETLAEDAAAAARLLRARHPGLPLLLLGESMGGAVAILAAERAPPVDRYVLLAPAIWSRAEMPALMRGGLWLVAHTMPVMSFGGGVGGVVASDNVEALRRLGRDPLVIRNTRIDAAIGLVDLMDQAAPALPGCCLGADGARVQVLLLYGARDSVVPPRPTRNVLRAIPPEAPIRLAVYAEGFHLLLSGNNRAVVVRDILAFAADPAAPLPSGAEAFAPEWLAR